MISGSISEPRHRYVSRVWSTAWEEYPEDLEWNSGQPRVISSRRVATRHSACAREMVSTWQVTVRFRPRILDCRGLSSRLDRCATEAISLNLLAVGLSSIVQVECTGRKPTRQKKTKSGTGGVKMFMGFEQDTTDVAKAQLARSGIVPVLPSEAEVEQHEFTHLPFRSWRRALRTCLRQGEPTP